MAQRTDGLRLLVGAVPVLAEGWLMPRLPQFIARHPGCSLHLQVFPTHLYMEDMPFDVGVQYDDAVWPGANALPLMGESCVAVCAPQAKGRAAMARGDFRARRCCNCAPGWARGKSGSPRRRTRVRPTTWWRATASTCSPC
jgi:DNA-binding transcriptional LysR family regulator